MYKLATKLAVIAVGILTFNCVFCDAQLYSTNTWANQPGYGYGYANTGVDSTGRYYGNAAGNGRYYSNGYDPVTGRRYDYGSVNGVNGVGGVGGAGYPGYDRDNVYGYGRQNGYNGRNYYGYYNGAVSVQRTGCVYWLTLALTTVLAFKVFV